MVHMRRWLLGLAVVGITGLAGCSSAGDTGGAPNPSPTGTAAAGSAGSSASTAASSMSSSTPPSIATTNPSPSASGSTTLFGSPPSRKPGARLTLTGTVQAGVEASCLVLEDEKTGLRVNVTGGDAAVVRVGARISVVGQIRSDLMSYCQQGPVFEVIRATTSR